MEEKLKKYWPVILGAVAVVVGVVLVRKNSAASTSSAGTTLTAATGTTAASTDTGSNTYNLQAQSEADAARLQGLSTILTFENAQTTADYSLQATKDSNATALAVKEAEMNSQTNTANQAASAAKHSADMQAATSIGSMIALAFLFSYQTTQAAAIARRPYSHGVQREGGPS
jgi:hypothetical protein